MDDDYFIAASPPPAEQPSALPEDEVERARKRRADRRRASLTLGVLAVLVLVALQVRPDTALGPLRLPDPVTVRTDAGVGAYRFLAVDGSGAPVRWDPCSPIRYVVNLEGAPYDTSLDDIATAFERVTEASGLRFAYVGETDELAREDRPLVQPDRYGPGWAPVLVAWTDPGHSPSLDGDVVASASTVPAGESPVYVSGSIHLDRTQRGLRPGFGRGRAWGTVLIHEAGHLVGLEHVDHEGEVMHPGGDRNRASATVRWGVGDREGLRLVGLESGCQDVPGVPTG